MPKLRKGIPEAKELEGGTWMPAPRARAVQSWILYAQAYPETICRKSVDGAVKGCEVLAEAELDLLETQWREKAVLAESLAASESSERWPLWQVVVLAAGGVAAGGLVGFVGAMLWAR